MHGNQPRTALITGAAKRIGAVIARDLADQGFSVAIHANSAMAEAEALAQDLQQSGKRAVAIRADLENEADTDALMAKAAQALGAIGLLVNNASVFSNDTAEDFDSQTWARHFALHVRAPAQLSAAFAHQLPSDRHGLIVNIIDQRVLALNPRFFSYTLSKSALWTATRTMAQAFAPRIRVNAIGPGPTMKSERQNEEDFQAQIDGVILKTGPKLDEFARTIRFLFDTPSITGQMISLDGGQHLAWQTPDILEITE